MYHTFSYNKSTTEIAQIILLLLVDMLQCIRLCYRDNQGSGQQCCYDNNGNLATGQPGGGTVDSYAPNNLTGSLNHLRNDILPYVYCCKGELKEYTCDMYYKKRPSDDGSRFILQPPG